MSAEQYTTAPLNVHSSESQQTVANNINTNSSHSETVDSKKNEKKQKRNARDENVLYIPVEEEDEPMHIKMKRIIPKIIDEYVTTYRKPIRRNKLQDLVFGYDEKLSNFYQEEKEAAVAVFSFALTNLLREKKIVKVKDPEKKRPTYFILPKHIEMFRKAE